MNSSIIDVSEKRLRILECSQMVWTIVFLNIILILYSTDITGWKCYNNYNTKRRKIYLLMYTKKLHQYQQKWLTKLITLLHCKTFLSGSVRFISNRH